MSRQIHGAVSSSKPTSLKTQQHSLFRFTQMQQWEETVEGCTNQFLNLIKTLADKYSSENLLCVTHDKTSYLDLKRIKHLSLRIKENRRERYDRNVTDLRDMHVLTLFSLCTAICLFFLGTFLAYLILVLFVLVN